MEASAFVRAPARGLLSRRLSLLRFESDERLIALIRGGNEQAFEQLFTRYQSRLLAFCQSMLKSRQDAEDVLQEVFANAHNAMLADEREIKVRPWLYRIARNRCLNHLRKPVPEGQDSMDIHPHANGTSTAEQAQNREELRQVLADVRTLPETQRTALLLREIDQLSYEEIAEAMGTTIPAIKSLLVRARIGLAESSQARMLTCEEVQVELAEAAEGISKASGPTRKHVRSCESCKEFRDQIRSDSKAMAALFPVGLIAFFQHGFLAKVFGGGAGSVGGSGAGAASGGAAAGAAGAAGGGGAIGGLGAVGGALGAKAAAGVATAALLTAGAVEVRQINSDTPDPPRTPSASVSTPVPPATAPKRIELTPAHTIPATYKHPAADKPAAAATRNQQQAPPASEGASPSDGAPVSTEAEAGAGSTKGEGTGETGAGESPAGNIDGGTEIDVGGSDAGSGGGTDTPRGETGPNPSAPTDPAAPPATEEPPPATEPESPPAADAMAPPSSQLVAPSQSPAPPAESGTVTGK